MTATEIIDCIVNGMRGAHEGRKRFQGMKMHIFNKLRNDAFRFAASVVLLGVLGALTGCGGGGGSGDGNIPTPPTSSAPTLQSIEVTPSIPQAAAGTTAQFAATAILGDGSRKDVTAEVTWTSSNTGAATVSNAAGSNGLATTAGVGSTTISASTGGMTGSTTLTVTPAVLMSIEVTPANPSVAKGLTRQLTATGVFSDNSTQDLTTQVTWSSTNTAAVTVSNTTGSKGRATTPAVGTATISASSGSVTGSTTLTVTPAVLGSIGVTPASPSVAKGLTRQLTATGVFSDNSTQDLTSQVSWASSNTAAATVSNTTGAKGLTTSVAVGTTTISASSGGVTGSTTLTVTPAVLGSIGVTPASPSVAKGLTRQLTATGVFSDNSTQDLTSQVTWASSDTGVTTVSNAAGSNGLVTSAAVGTTTISASSGGVTGSTTLTVTAATLVAIGVTPASPSVAKGLTRQFTATGIYTDSSTQDLTSAATWASSNTGVATVSNAAGSNGLATTAAVGVATVSATSGDVIGSTALTVTPAELASIEVTPASASVAKGLTQQFMATGVYTDNSTQDLTTQVTWTSSAAVATISNAAGSNGLATTTDVGSSTVSATSGDVTGSTALTVTPAELVSIEVTPVNSSLAKGLTQQFTATGIYTDNATQDLTSQVTWTSSDGSVATVSNATGSNGLATTTDLGSSTVSATSGDVSGNTVLTVTAATLVSIAVTPSVAGLPNGLTRQYTATGVYTDNSTQALTTAVAWASSNTGVATVSNAAGSQGLATITGVGTTMISATMIGGIAGSTSLVARSVDVSGRSNPWNQLVNPTMPYSNDAFAPLVVQLNTLGVVAGSYLNLVCTGGTTNAGGLPNTGCAGLNSGYQPSDDRFQPACNHYYPTKYVDSSYYPTYIMQVLGAFADANGVVVGRPFPISPNTLRVQVPSGAVRLQLGMNDCLNSDNSSAPLTLRIFN